MNDEERVKEWVRGKDKELSALHGVNEHGKFFLSPDIREQIINVFTSDSDLALIDREKRMPKALGNYGEISPIDAEVKTRYSFINEGWKPVIPLAPALKEME